MQCINHLATVVIPHNIHIDYRTTPRVLEMWEKSIDELTKHQASRPPHPPDPTLAQEDISNLFIGSQLGSRITRQTQGDYSDDSDDDNYGEEQDDPDYVVNYSDLELNYSDYSDDISEDLNEELDDLIADQIADEEEETFSDKMTFLEDLLQSLRDLNRGKIDWSEMDVNDLVNKFLKHPQECMKMVVDKLNLIGNLIQTYTGIKVFNVSDNKALKINKLMANLQTSSQELILTRRQGRQTRRVKTLKQLARKPVMEPVYSKEYLQIVVANTMFADAVNQWLNQTTLPMAIRVASPQTKRTLRREQAMNSCLVNLHINLDIILCTLLCFE